MEKTFKFVKWQPVLQDVRKSPIWIWIFEMIRIFIRKSAKGTEIQREYGKKKKYIC